MNHVAILGPGWLRRDTVRASITVAKETLQRCDQRVRQLNDELCDACTAVKAAKAELRKLERLLACELSHSN